MSSVTSTTSSTNTMRITGMATGLDTDSMVKAMTANIQSKIDKENQEKQIAQWKQDMYRDIIKDVKGLQDYFDPTSTKYILGSSKFNPVAITNSNESIVGFSTTSTAQAGNYKIDVTKLAKPALLQGNAISATSGTKLDSLGVTDGSKLTFTINGNSVTTNEVTNTTTIQDVIDTINNNPNIKGKVTASFDDLTKKFVFSTSSSGTTSNLSVAVSSNNTDSTKATTDVISLGLYSNVTPKLEGSAIVATGTTKLDTLGINNNDSISFTINGKVINTTISDASATSVQDMLNSINNDSNMKTLGVTASFDETSKKIVFATNNSGTASNIDISSVTGGTNLGLGSLTVPSATGQDAEFNLSYPDGRTESIKQTSNQFTANGITYNLKSIGTSTVTVTKNNVDTIVDNLKKFKDDYNDLIDKIQGKLTEKKQFSYKPLSDDQKKDMKDADIANWETKAKQGLLKNDENLENLLGDLKSAFSDNVFTNFDTTKDTYHQDNASKLSLHVGIYDKNAIGIDTSSDISSLGKIEIKDETKLKDAISNHIEEFTQLFIGKSSAKLDVVNGVQKPYKDSEKYYEDGIFTRMDNIIRNYAGDPGIGKDGTSTVKGILNIYANKQYDYSISGYSSKNTLPDQIYGKALSVTDLTDKLKDAQDRYYKKFAALETAMNNMNTQMNSFKSQMGIS